MKSGALLNNDPDWEYQSFDFTASAACVCAPAIMWITEMVDRGELLAPRNSISSYHDVLTAGAFFVPLTIAVMLFVVNGWIYAGHRIHVAMGATSAERGRSTLFLPERFSSWAHFLKPCVTTMFRTGHLESGC